MDFSSGRGEMDQGSDNHMSKPSRGLSRGYCGRKVALREELSILDGGIEAEVCEFRLERLRNIEESIENRVRR